MKICIHNHVYEIKSSLRGNRYKSAELKGNFGIWNVAGHGQRTNELCNTVKSVFANESNNEVILKGYGCKNLQCPECFEAAAVGRGQKVALKIMARAKEYAENVYHYTFHPINVDQNYDKLVIQGRINSSAERYGVEYDLNQSYFEKFNTEYVFDGKLYQKKFPKRVKRTIKNDYNLFKTIRRRFRYFLENLGLSFGILVFHPGHLDGADMIEWYPHWHFVGTRRHKIMNADKFYETYGFTYKNHGRRKFGFQIASTCSYILNHCGVIREKQSYYYLNYTQTKDVMGKKSEPYQDSDGNFYYRLDRDSITLKGKFRYSGPFNDKVYVMDDNLSVNIGMKCWEYRDTMDGIADKIPLVEVKNHCAFGRYVIHDDIFDIPDKIMKDYKSSMKWDKDKNMLVVQDWDKYRKACAAINTWEGFHVEYRGQLKPLVKNISPTRKKKNFFIVA